MTDESTVEIVKHQEEALNKLDVAGRMYEQIDLVKLIDMGEFKSLSELQAYLLDQSSKLNTILKLPCEEWVMTKNFCLDIQATIEKANHASGVSKGSLTKSIKFKAIDGVKLDRPVEFSPYVNDSGCYSVFLEENETYILDTEYVKPFIVELAKLDKQDLIEETLQSLSQREDGTYLKTAFPDLSTFSRVAEKMQSIPHDLKVLLTKWERLGANEIHIDFEQKC